MKCEECKYFKEQSWTFNHGACRRHAPVISTIKIVTEKYDVDCNNHPVFPSVEYTDWCGDFEVKRG